ncbi:MAG TPA: TadE/TadG family type IV pilus assembly protein [Candidatus Dormibacteraeota bacterium]|nr:TadE/TadG family type IV pilus assembly protein [Candidatus Dormibacteraeota bacterium]
MEASRRTRRRTQVGQALVEFALLTPPLLLFVLLTVDVGRAYWESIDAAGAARAGVRMGIISDTSDIGGAVRDEPNSGIPNTVAAWGSVGPGTAWGTCTSGTSTCGDPNGCASTSFSGTQIACFALRTCTLSSGGDLGTITGCGPWGLRPLSGGHALQLVVVIKFPAVTPALAAFVTGGVLYLRQSDTGNELYF